MAGLWPRMYERNPDNEFSDAGGGLYGNYLAATLSAYVHSQITVSQAKNFWNLDVQASNQFDVLIAEIDALTTIEEKSAVVTRIRDAGTLAEADLITTKEQWEAMAGLS